MRERFFLPLPAILKPPENAMDGIGKSITYTAILFLIAVRLGLTHFDKWSLSMLVKLFVGAAFYGAGVGMANALQANRP